jgi:hypothetical protein
MLCPASRTVTTSMRGLASFSSSTVFSEMLAGSCPARITSVGHCDVAYVLPQRLVAWPTGKRRPYAGYVRAEAPRAVLALDVVHVDALLDRGLGHVRIRLADAGDDIVAGGKDWRLHRLHRRTGIVRRPWRGVLDHQSVDVLGVNTGVRVRDRATHRMTNQHKRRKLKLLRQHVGVRHEIVDGVRTLRVPVAGAVAALIQGHDVVPPGEGLADIVPRHCRAAEAMQQQDGRRCGVSPLQVAQP